GRVGRIGGGPRHGGRRAARSGRRPTRRARRGGPSQARRPAARPIARPADVRRPPGCVCCQAALRGCRLPCLQRPRRGRPFLLRADVGDRGPCPGAARVGGVAHLAPTGPGTGGRFLRYRPVPLVPIHAGLVLRAGPPAMGLGPAAGRYGAPIVLPIRLPVRRQPPAALLRADVAGLSPRAWLLARDPAGPPAAGDDPVRRRDRVPGLPLGADPLPGRFLPRHHGARLRRLPAPDLLRIGDGQQRHPRHRPPFARALPLRPRSKRRLLAAALARARGGGRPLAAGEGHLADGNPRRWLGGAPGRRLARPARRCPAGGLDRAADGRVGGAVVLVSLPDLRQYRRLRTDRRAPVVEPSARWLLPTAGRPRLRVAALQGDLGRVRLAADPPRRPVALGDRRRLDPRRRRPRRLCRPCPSRCPTGLGRLDAAAQRLAGQGAGRALRRVRRRLPGGGPIRHPLRTDPGPLLLPGRDRRRDPLDARAANAHPGGLAADRAGDRGGGAGRAERHPLRRVRPAVPREHRRPDAVADGRHRRGRRSADGPYPRRAGQPVWGVRAV
ncbi:MAG: hypothetical protein AVDCRST_MAG59-132, partial [uncultured Thermomicrobiales bacterium]